MMPEMSAYRQRTRDVRSAARERLRELREERLARRVEAPSQAGPTTDTHCRKGIAVSRAASIVAAGGTVAEPEAAGDRGERSDREMSADRRMDSTSDAEAHALADSGENDVLPSEVDSRGTIVADADATQACDIEACDIDDSEVSDASPSRDALGVAQQSSVAPDAPSHADPSLQALNESDLTLLPGAGNGLVWMLGQCGITTLAELGRADADELAERMGLVGQMLDLHAWIDFASAATEEVSDRHDTFPP